MEDVKKENSGLYNKLINEVDIGDQHIGIVFTHTKKTIKIVAKKILFFVEIEIVNEYIFCSTWLNHESRK